jgi:hypothetical protein
MSGDGNVFISGETEERGDHKQVPSQEILIRLRKSMMNAISEFTKNSGLPSEKIISALNEYFSVDVSLIYRMIPE